MIITKWQDKPIVVEGIGKAKSVLMLGFSGKLKYSVLGNKLTIMPPAVSPATIPCNYSWVYKIENVTLEAPKKIKEEKSKIDGAK